MRAERVLILYATTEGHTEKVAAHLAEVARRRAHPVDVIRIGDGTVDVPLRHFDAILIGGSVHLHAHQRELVDFVKHHRVELDRVPSAFFSVSLASSAHDEGSQREARSYIDAFVEETGWRPARIGLFGGALAYTRYGFLKRRLMQGVARRVGMPTDARLDHEYTDWRDVESFAEAFLGDLPSARAGEEAAAP